MRLGRQNQDGPDLLLEARADGEKELERLPKQQEVPEPRFALGNQESRNKTTSVCD